MALTKEERRLRIKRRIRKIVSGTAERPRMSVYRSNAQISVQLIDDKAGKTLLSVSSLCKEIAEKKGNKTEQKRATPTTKSGDAENGKYRFATLPCMRNGSFTPLTSIFKTKKLNRVIKWQEKR